MTTGIILVVLVIFAMITIKSYAKKIVSGCCGAGGDKEEKIKSLDTDPANYPYRADVEIGGMHCQKCADRIENAFNRQEGFYAIVNLKNGSAKIYAKKKLTDFEVRSVIVGLEYSVEKMALVENC
jgi:copper chaperone CopZ